MKYVMLQDSMGGLHGVVFPDSLTHSTVAKGICRQARLDGETLGLMPISAGFYDPQAVRTYGMSESMGMESVETDAYHLFFGQSVSMLPPEDVKMLYGKYLLKKSQAQ